MTRLILVACLFLASCIQMGDAVMLIEGHARPKAGGVFQHCTLQVFYDDTLYEQRQIPPAFQVDLTVAPGAEPARVDIACEGSNAIFSKMTKNGEDIVRFGDIYLD